MKYIKIDYSTEKSSDGFFVSFINGFDIGLKTFCHSELVRAAKTAYMLIFLELGGDRTM